ncbi:MAG: hypothetical protein VW907_07795, partial [Opitutae bacterium]
DEVELKQYFDDNNLAEVGFIYDMYDDGPYDPHSPPGEDGHQEFEPVSIDEVAGFVEALIAQVPELEGVDPVRAEKILDALNENRFVYEV